MTPGNLPKWICNKITESDIQKIEDSVAQVEGKTQGEIVPMIVRRSLHNEDLQIGFTLFLLFSVIFLVAHQIFPTPEISELTFELVGFSVSAVLGFLLAKIDRVQMLFVSQDEMIARVYERAELEFYRARINHTHKRVGILLFLSLAEHRAVVLADKGIAEKLKSEDWLAVVRLMTRGARENRLGAGMCDAVRECGKILSEHFPADEKYKNEISNKLVLHGD